MTDRKVVNTFEATAAVLAAINKTLDVHDAILRQARADILALSNRIEALTQATRHIQRLPSEW